MIPTDNLNKLLKKSRAVTSIEMDRKVHNDILELLEKSKTQASAKPQQRPSIRRIIVKNRMTRLAVAAVVIIAVIIGVNQFIGQNNVISVAFALDDAVEALKHVENVHMIMITNQPPGTYEFWTKYSQNGEVIASRTESPEGRLTVSVDDVTYNYIPDLDRVNIYSWKKNVDRDPKLYVEQMASHVAKLGATVTKQFESDEETSQEVLAMTITLKDIPLKADRVGDIEAKIIFNTETKLPIRAQEFNIENGQKHRRAHYEFSYNEEFPDNLFEFEIPDGAQVVDSREKPVQPDEIWKLEDIVKVAHSHFSQIKDVEFDFTSRLVILAHHEDITETESTLAWVPEEKWEKRLDRVRKSTGEQYKRFHSWDEVQENNSRGFGLSDILTYLGLKEAKFTFIDYLTMSDVIIEGVEKIDGRKTVVINVNLTPSIPREEGLFRKYWLDIERGALPLRVELYHKEILRQVVSCVTISEIEPGLFFPVSCNVSGGLGRKNEVDETRKTGSYQFYKVDINSIKINQGLERQYFDVEFDHSPASWDTAGVK